MLTRTEKTSEPPAAVASRVSAPPSLTYAPASLHVAPAEEVGGRDHTPYVRDPVWAEKEKRRRARVLNGAPADAVICPECDGYTGFISELYNDDTYEECGVCEGRGWVEECVA